MKFKHFLTAASIALLPLAASAATIVVPAAGTGPGANDSHWQSELTLHNSGATALTVNLTFHQNDAVAGPVAVTLAGRSTESISDIVKTKFGVDAGTGAIVIDVADASAKRLAVSSRTFNASANGEFGQDIPAINTTDASGAGDITVLAAPSSALNYRFNFGVYAVTDAAVKWELVRANGTVAATVPATYKAGAQNQYNVGVTTFFNATPQDNDVVYATVTTGKAIFYGSAVNQSTGDPSFVGAVRTREDIRINFAGIDLDENGSIDLADADRDGVVDHVMDLQTSMFPNFFRLVATGENGEAVTYEVISSPADILLVDANGTIEVAPSGNLKGTKGEIRIRATAGGSSSILVIPVNFF